jgi:Cu/Ag efflux protein CusF
MVASGTGNARGSNIESKAANVAWETTMTRTPLLLALAVTILTATPVLAQHDHTAMAMPAKSAATAAPNTEGVVKRIDRAGSRVTIAHEAIRNLDMPKMTMAFRVSDPSWLERLKEGDRIRFAAENPNGVLTLVAFEPAK